MLEQSVKLLALPEQSTTSTKCTFFVPETVNCPALFICKDVIVHLDFGLTHKTCIDRLHLVFAPATSIKHGFKTIKPAPVVTLTPYSSVS